jgi:hypothetical protein
METNEKLIREFIKESIRSDSSPAFLFEYTPGSGGAALRSALSGAASKFADVVKGEFKNVFASIKQLGGITYQAVKEVGTLGLFKADYEGVKAKYQAELAEIDKKYGRQIEEARKNFSSVLSPFTTAAKLGLGATATALFFANPIAFTAVAGIASDTSKQAKTKVLPAVAAGILAAKTGLDKWAGHDEEDEEDEDRKIEKESLATQDWVKKAQSDVRSSLTRKLREIEAKVNSIMSARSVEDLKLPSSLTKKLTQDSKNKDAVLMICKGMALKEILNSIELERSKLLEEGKKIFKDAPETALTGKGSYIGVYDQIISMIKKKISSLG